MSDLQHAIVNLAPMAEEPVIGLDASWVRLVLESRQVPKEGWTDMTRKFLILHNAREKTRR